MNMTHTQGKGKNRTSDFVPSNHLPHSDHWSVIEGRQISSLK